MTSHAASIAESVDPEYVGDLLGEISDHDLPPVLDEVVTEYQSVPAARPRFMWNWVHKLAPQNTLPCVDARYADDLPVDKTLLILFITILDDLLEKRRDAATFHAAATIPTPHLSVDWHADRIDTATVEIAALVWETLVDRLERGENYEHYEPLFRFDVKQAINAIEYSHLVIDRPTFATTDRLERIESHNMAMFAYADMDLMHSAIELEGDFPVLRDAVWHAQQMARLGNWASTWHRELQEGDCSSGVVVAALERGIIDHSELPTVTSGDGTPFETLVDRIEAAGVEDQLLQRWDAHYDALYECNADLTTMDITPYIEGLRDVLRYHLASTGLK